MGRLFDLLSEEDKNIFNNYVKSYSFTKNNVGIEKMLYDWDVNKRKLYKLLGNQFIYSFPYEVENPPFKIGSLADFEFSHSAFYRQLKKGIDLLPESLENFSKNTLATIERYLLYPNLVDLGNNKISLPHSEIAITRDKTLKDGTVVQEKLYTLKNGEKFTRALYNFKLFLEKFLKVSIFDEDSYNSFCNEYSKILQKRKEKGNIYFSIHPLDFATMSDNNNDWTSCMSWADSGCYRLGSYEMLSSNNVIMCYTVSDDKKFTIRPNSRSSNDILDEWNSKNWRMLIIVNNKCIISGKQYPNTGVDQKTTLCLEKVRELAKKNLGWDFTSPVETYNPYQEDTNIDLKTHFMYNDFFEAKDYPSYKIINNSDRNKKYSFCYSGKVRCLDCGRVLKKKYIYTETHFRCKKCSDIEANNKEICSCCSEVKPSEFIFKMNNKKKKYYICSDCYSNKLFGIDFLTKEEYPNKELITLCFSNSQFEIDEIKNFFNQLKLDKNIVYHSSFFNEPDLYLKKPNIYSLFQMKYSSNTMSIRVNIDFFIKYIKDNNNTYCLFKDYFPTDNEEDRKIGIPLTKENFPSPHNTFIFFDGLFKNSQGLKKVLLNLEPKEK